MIDRLDHVPAPVLWTISGILALLVVASLIVLVLRRTRPDRDFTELALRVKSWWFMVAAFSFAMVTSVGVSLILFALISFLALKEYLSLIPTRRADRRVLFWAYLAVPAQYYWVATGWYGMFIVFVPVYVFLALPTRMILIGHTEGFLRAAGTLHWGLMTTVFNLSHAAYLLKLGDDGPGLLLALVVLTQLNDVAQYVWGKSLGARKISPTVSPGKTWGGFLGGVGTTTLLSTLLSPHLTPMTTVEAAGIGLLIGVGGFFGDLTISALKRDLGVKDSGSLLPGHGGILDRVDSLGFTAPLFFHVVYWLHY